MRIWTRILLPSPQHVVGSSVRPPQTAERHWQCRLYEVSPSLPQMDPGDHAADCLPQICTPTKHGLLEFNATFGTITVYCALKVLEF